MRTHYLILSFFFLAVQVVTAQSFTMGPKAGVSFKDLQGKGATNYTILPDFNVGLAWNYTGNAALNVGGEVLYSRQGGRFRNTVISTSRTTLHYVAVPVLLKYYFWSQTRTTPFLFAGLQLGYLLGAHNTKSGDVGALFKNTDVSGVAGAGLRIQMEKVWWTMDVRTSPGITNISEGTATVRNTVLSANTSIEFGSKKKSRRGLH